MLVELSVTNLGVIEQARLVLSDSMTALTGETGAGKTMIVQAVHLLTGGRAEALMVRTGTEEAVVEGRFVCDTPLAGAAAATGDASASDTSDRASADTLLNGTPSDPSFDSDAPTELVLTRVVSATGRSRAYVNGQMATVARLAELGADLIDLHGQHQHQSLLAARTQREALDAYAKIDLTPLREASRSLARLQSELVDLGGDERSRAQEVDMLRYQINEIEDLAIDDPNELETIAEREDLLADAAAHIQAAHAARAALVDDPGGSENTAIDKLGEATAALANSAPFNKTTDRLKALHAELADCAAELLDLLDTIDEDPQELENARARRQLLLDMTRKYGDTLTAVLDFAQTARTRLAELTQHDELAARLEQEIAEATTKLAAAAAKVAKARRRAAPKLGAEVSALLPSLAMAGAEVSVEVNGEDPADNVEMRVATNSGQTPGPLSKVASGGELARIMLALRLVLTAGPPTLVFDEVDAGIGGEAAMAVGRSLAQLATEHQVLVVTHLPQVGAFASQQVAVRKTDDGTTVASDLIDLDHEARVEELTRMLAGMPESSSGRVHASELLAAADHRHNTA